MKQKNIDFRVFNTPQDVKNWIQYNYSIDRIEQLTTMLHSDTALSEYKGGFYKVMNRYLRYGVFNPEDYDIVGLQKMLSNCSLPESIVTHRFVSILELVKLYTHTIFGRVFQYPTFLSTTLLDKDYSMQEIKAGRVKIRFFAPKGTPGTFLPEIKENRPEFEVLFAYGLKIKCVGLLDFSIVLED